MNILEVFGSGQVGGIEFGHSRAMVEARYGPPEGIGENPPVIIYKYSDVQLSFRDDRLARIQLWMRDEPLKFPKSFGSIESPLISSMTPFNFVEFIEPVCPGWHIYERLTFDRQLCIVAPPHIFAFFDLDRRKFQKLDMVKDFNSYLVC